MNDILNRKTPKWADGILLRSIIIHYKGTILHVSNTEHDIN